MPKAVGIVTSPTGAALRDMLRILRDRFPIQVYFVAAKVQGEGAAESIAQGIEWLDQMGLCDVIIAGRGGGSLEDLWAFNEERLVRAFANCRTPIVSAVGHETDTLLTDFAADVRAPTPTAAAEMVVPQLRDLLATLAQQRQRMQSVLQRLLTSERRHLGQLTRQLGDGGQICGHRAILLDDLQRRLLHAARQQFSFKHRLLGQLRQRLNAAHPLRRLGQQQRKLDALQNKLAHLGAALLQRRLERLRRATGLLQALSPRAALGRGYSIVRRAGSGEALQSVAGVAVGAVVEVLLHDGALDCTVNGVQTAVAPS